ncbi:MAG: hypothetical protein KDJ63_06355 [Nitratireductor sp.]|nr:hypothetical protein [Nitratireductor sp.]
MKSQKHLVQRGYTWYWRARIPAKSAKNSEQTRFLSVSLKTRDHTEAVRMAARMSLEFQELVMSETIEFLSTDQVRDIVSQAAVSKHEKAERIRASNIRIGDHIDPEEVVADLAMGCAYNLLAEHGAYGFTFGQKCLGRKLLEERKFTEKFIDQIAACFRYASQEVYGDKAKAVALNYLESRKVELTPLNFDNYHRSIARGKSQAMIHGAFERYPHVPMESVHRSQYGLPYNPNTVEVYTGGGSVTVEDVREIATSIKAPPLAPEHSGPNSEPARAAPKAADPAVQPPPATNLKGENVPLRDLGMYVESLVTAKDDAWTAKSGKQAHITTTLFVSFLKDQGVSHTAGIRQRHLMEFRLALSKINPNWGKSRKKGEL